jgi:hypothetical protein
MQNRLRATSRLVFSERALVQAHNHYIYSILKRPQEPPGLRQDFPFWLPVSFLSFSPFISIPFKQVKINPSAVHLQFGSSREA